MTMCTIILKGNKQYKHVLCNWNGLASIKFGLGASFLALSLVDRNSPGGLGGGGVCHTVENPEGRRGNSLPQKTENPGRRGVLSEISICGRVWIFSGTTHC